MNVPLSNVFGTLQTYLGSTYVNDLTLFGRTYRVTAQADAPHRLAPEQSACSRRATPPAAWSRSARLRP
jgi:multidrug efflux pump subunit AcrB